MLSRKRKYCSKLMYCFICIAFILFAFKVKAQKQDSNKVYKNNINLELFGKAIDYSIQYERAVWIKNKSQVLISVGVDPYRPNTGEFNPTVITPSFAVNYTYGNKWKLFVSESLSFTIPIQTKETTWYEQPYVKSYVNTGIAAHYYYWFNSIGVVRNFGSHFFMRLYGALTYIYNKKPIYNGIEPVAPEKDFAPYLGIDFGYRF